MLSMHSINISYNFNINVVFLPDPAGHVVPEAGVHVHEGAVLLGAAVRLLVVPVDPEQVGVVHPLPVALLLTVRVPDEEVLGNVVHEAPHLEPNIVSSVSNCDINV